MNKEEIQQRVLRNGRPIELDLFSWDEKTLTFATGKDGLVMDFSGLPGLTINCGSNNTITCWYNNTIRCWSHNTINCVYNNTINCESDNTITCGRRCVVVRRDIYEVHQINNTTITLAPYQIPGYIEGGKYSVTGKPAIIADGILSEIVGEKTKADLTVYQVINHGQEKQSYLVKCGDIYSHGDTIKEATDGLRYKLADRDTSRWNGIALDAVLTQDEAIQMYMAVTGACASGTRYFVERLDNAPDKLTVGELIEITRGQYNHDMLVAFMEGKDGGE